LAGENEVGKVEPNEGKVIVILTSFTASFELSTSLSLGSLE
jgi:hypothetical protein